jgi:hypothetical protein
MNECIRCSHPLTTPEALQTGICADCWTPADDDVISMVRPIPYPKPNPAARPRPDWEAFGKAIMRHWPEGGPDGFELQDVALEHNVIIPVPGGYDPEVHGDDPYDAEPGDEYFQRNYQP